MVNRKVTNDFRFQRYYGLVQDWENARLSNSELISKPIIPSASFSLPNQDWVTLYRLRTGIGRCGQLIHRWHLKNNPACNCG